MALRSSTEPPAAPEAPSSDTFPAGTAALALGAHFLLKRVAVRATASSAPLDTAASALGALGAVLAVVAVARSLALAYTSARSPAGRGAVLTRGALFAPLALHVLYALHAEPPHGLQWLALGAAAATVAGALGGAAVAPGVMPLARATLALLLTGELIELAAAPAQAGALALASVPHGPAGLPRALGAVSELATLTGAWLALAWSAVATARAAGSARARLFAPMPAFTGVVLVVMSWSLPERAVAYVALGTFGARFDLLRFFGLQGPPPRAALVWYLLAPVAVLAASVVSLGGVLHERSAAPRRVLGWAVVLVAGFGALRLAGPADPLRLAAVCLASVLLADAARFGAAPPPALEAPRASDAPDAARDDDARAKKPA